MNRYGELIQSIDDFAFVSTAFAEGWKVYGPFDKQDGRKIVIVIEEDGTRRTISYPKWLLSKHLGRLLDPDSETCDHIDRNKDNNDISNLRLVERKQHSADDTRRVRLVKFKCDMCKKDFERSPRLVRDKSKKGNRGIFCSRHCSGKYSRRLQLGLIDKFPVQPYIESEYYRNIKNLANLADNFLIKYASDIIDD